MLLAGIQTAVKRLRESLGLSRGIVSWLGRMFGSAHHIVRAIEPWSILLTLIGLVLAFSTIMVEAEDRRSERIFRAWEVVLRVTDTDQGRPLGSGSAIRQALEYLNRRFDGWGCFDLITRLSIEMTGNDKRRCLFPRKNRESLSRLSMGGIDLSDVDLRHANLTESILSNVNFVDAMLSDATFNGSTIVDGRFNGADLQRAKFYDATLSGVFLLCADMSGAELGAATLSTVVASDLTTSMLCRKQSMGPYALELSDANLSGADISNADLRFSNLTNAKFGAAVLEDTKLCGANISGVEMGRVKGLSQNQIDLACARNDNPPVLPAELKWNAGNSRNDQCAYLETLSGWKEGKERHFQLRHYPAGRDVTRARPVCSLESGSPASGDGPEV